jgi:hypothetical protein
MVMPDPDKKSWIEKASVINQLIYVCTHYRFISERKLKDSVWHFFYFMRTGKSREC